MRADLRKAPAQIGHMRDEIGEIVALAAKPVPVHPADLIVLAIGIVIAGLGVADLVASEDQGHALRQEQAGELIFPEPAPYRIDVRIVGRPLMAAIVAVVVVGAVAIVLAIGF